MPRKILICLAALSLMLTLGGALAEAPQLEDVLPGSDVVWPGGALVITFRATDGGNLRVTAAPDDSSGAQPLLWLDQPIAQGVGSVAWDATLGGQPASPGPWVLTFSLTSGAGERSMLQAVVVEVLAPPEPDTAAPAPAMDSPAGAGETPEPGPPATAEAQGYVAPSTQRQVSPYPDPHENCFWQMDPTNYNVYDPADQAKIWDILMQPISVLDVGPTDHVYPLIDPTGDPSDTANMAGQVHGTTQGVHVLETRQDGWSLIEAYANDGQRAPDESLQSYAAKLIQGYVKTSRIKTVTPNQNIALVIDKLTQRLYIFQKGKLTGELLVSTGFPTKSQPFNETPAGEFLTASWVGMFVNGKMQCDLAIRINGGVLLHEVPHIAMADETRNYTPFEPYLGQKASHGCVRVQRMRSNAGFNMAWLWKNLKRNAKVLVWDDAGRAVQPQPPGTTYYYNPDGGKSYHSDQNCAAVRERFLPLTPLAAEELYVSPTDKLIPCYGCLPPAKVADPSQITIPDDVIGAGTDDI
ncbi:MAG: L,D-transpeptidase family protein [Oscillospiraceae bacterium]|nr:L,D-transpeptidase family protein [Oscillospiraceae bacterium]